MHPLLELFIDFAEREGIAIDSFIVGGAVRDILLGKELKDIDIAVKGDAINISKRFAQEINGSFVLLDKEFGIARIVKDTQFLDISILRGDSIYSDLSDRDLTINAMAIPLPEVRSQKSEIKSKLIDPYNGGKDLSNKIIRMVSEENLIKDPLRILRIYRFAATLNFSIEDNTLNTAKRLAPLITSVAVERIAEELRYIVRLDDSYKTIKSLQDDNILSYVFPELKSLELRVQSLELYKSVEDILKNPSHFLPSTFNFQLPTLKKICLKLSTLFPSPAVAKQSAIRLKLSKKEVDFIYEMALNRNKISELYKDTNGVMDETKVIRLLKESSDNIYPLIILSVAQEPFLTVFCKEILGLYEDVFKPRASLLPIITGNDLTREFNIKPSPAFKKILAAVEDLVLKGRITSREEALKIVSKMIKNE